MFGVSIPAILSKYLLKSVFRNKIEFDIDEIRDSEDE